MTTLERLPPEILADGVLAYLCARDILRCSSVCTYLRDVVQVSLALQYKIELGAEGLNPSSRHGPCLDTTITSDSLESLRQRRQAWRTLSWERIEVIEVPKSYFSYEFIDGVFAKSNGWSPSEIAIVYLPSRTQAAKQIIHSPEKIDVLAADITIDPKQDLLVLTRGWYAQGVAGPVCFTSEDGELETRVLSLSTGDKHPLARSRTMSVSGCKAAITFYVRLFIVGDKFSIMLGSGHFLIWNWMSGDLLVNHDFRTGGRYVSLSFLSSRFLLQEDDRRRKGFLSLYSFGDTLDRYWSETPEPLGILRDDLAVITDLELPPLARGCYYYDVDMFTSPIIEEYENPAGFVLISCLCQWNNGRIGDVGRGVFRIIISRRLLLKRINDFSENGLPHIIPWAQWGPDVTRIFVEPKNKVNIDGWRPCTTSSCRVAFDLAFNEEQLQGLPRQEIVEFGSHLKRPDAHLNTSPSIYCGRNEPHGVVYRNQTQLEPSMLKSSRRNGDIPFAIPIETRLPYHSISMDIPPGLSSQWQPVMIDDERMVLMHASSGALNTCLDVFVM